MQGNDGGVGLGLCLVDVGQRVGYAHATRRRRRVRGARHGHRSGGGGGGGMMIRSGMCDRSSSAGGRSGHGQLE